MTRRALALASAILLGLPAAAAEGGASGKALITPQYGLVIWTLVTFVLLLFVLKRVAWKPLLRAVEERERSIRESLEGARADRERAQALLEEQRALVEQARRERAGAIEQGRADAERLKVEILEEARRHKDDLVRQAGDQIETAVRKARSELRVAAADLAIQAAGKLLADNLDDAVQRKLVEDYLAELERLPAGTTSLSS